VDLVTEGAKPRLVADLGARYHSTPVAELRLEPDIVIECTGVGQVVIDATHLAAPGAVVALTGISQDPRTSRSWST
jgi:threonine dehydrogenase-like Zn-dependent dehydrogenase